uniref:Uncharacterized protein n=1 Tax=Arundo donax TaxID=35708 RepID=A0A0A9BXD8_ARUDO
MRTFWKTSFDLLFS